ncbi:MAG: hypothetical protein HYZ29_26600 [Myxococcales bacterium]|nr:hypothetical protein [Myxococcales bacterium]
MRLTFRRFAVLTLFGGAAFALLVRFGALPESPVAAPSASAPDLFPNPWPTPPPPDVAALLGGLGPGAALRDGWRVRGVSPVHEQRIVIDVDKSGVGFRVALMREGRDERVPPKRTARYALYTIQPRPTADAVHDADYAVVLTAIAAVVTEHEATAPVPAGL